MADRKEQDVLSEFEELAATAWVLSRLTSPDVAACEPLEEVPPAPALDSPEMLEWLDIERAVRLRNGQRVNVHMTALTAAANAGVPVTSPDGFGPMPTPVGSRAHADWIKRAVAAFRLRTI